MNPETHQLIERLEQRKGIGVRIPCLPANRPIEIAAFLSAGPRRRRAWPPTGGSARN